MSTTTPPPSGGRRQFRSCPGCRGSHRLELVGCICNDGSVTLTDDGTMIFSGGVQAKPQSADAVREAALVFAAAAVVEHWLGKLQLPPPPHSASTAGFLRYLATAILEGGVPSDAEGTAGSPSS